MDYSVDQIGQLTVSFAIKLVVAAVIWFIGTTVAKMICDALRRVLRRQNGIDPSVANFSARALNWVMIGAIIVAILDLFNIETTGIVAILGAATLAVGLALKDTLANFAAGVMILLFRPFATGDFIEVSGEMGTVRNINLFRTEIATVDNIQIIIPNNDTWTTVLKNYSAYDRRRMDLVIGVDYGADMDEAVRIVRQVVTSDLRALHDPEPFVKVTNLGASSVDITARVWCKREDLFDFKFEVTKRIKEALDQAGISIPFPHMQVVVEQPSADLPKAITS